MATIEKLCAPSVYDPPGYSGVDRPGDFLAQARNVFGAVTAHVEAAGGTLSDVVKITTYVTDIRYRMDFRAVRDEFFGQRDPRPLSFRWRRSPTPTT